MPVTLIESKGLPPGGIVFHDPRIGEKVWNDTKASLSERVSQVIEFRRQNPRVYDPVKDAAFLNPFDVENEITMFNFYRLGITSPYFNVSATTQDSIRNGCCGVQLEKRLCPTCSIPKVIGYRCPKCGKEFGL